MKTRYLVPSLTLLFSAPGCTTDDQPSETHAPDDNRGGDDDSSSGSADDDGQEVAIADDDVGVAGGDIGVADDDGAPDDDSSEAPAPNGGDAPGVGGGVQTSSGGTRTVEPEDIPNAGAGGSAQSGASGSGQSGSTASGGASNGGNTSLGGTAQGGESTAGATSTEVGCPSEPPEDGSPCVEPWTREGPRGLTHCTWGADVRPDCRTKATCSDERWVVTPSDAGVCGVSLLPAACPTAPPPESSDCSEESLDCWYVTPASPEAPEMPTTHCFCACGGPSASDPGCEVGERTRWDCDLTRTGCPATLPQAGSSCDQEGLHCGPRCDFNVDCYDSTWQWYNEPCRVCASPETQISTPEGERGIATLTVGDVVFSVDHGEIVAVPLIRVSSMPVSHHHMMRVALENGRVLSISPGHPTWDGRTFADLVAGSRLDERFRVVDAELVPYEYDHTYDILPDSDTGTYFAEGALIGSTLFTPNVPPQWSRDGSGSIPLEATAASSPPAHVPPAGSAGLSRAPRKPAARP